MKKTQPTELASLYFVKGVGFEPTTFRIDS